ncbi:hypothetical protein QBC37DRAFT_288322 [Rhypophila decipiens]|uniref:DUF3533 domain-containing protein n=1 Tax=Rhypophila decipiens TaxID=261697 RepID=A0AAN6Y5M3_9PEZI|nr:hypothetical protein QBC37DRAFT_288322 [Rhypophila decipiens]
MSSHFQLIKSHYPRAFDKKLPSNHPSRKKAAKCFLKDISLNFVILQVVFLALFAYVFGSLFQQTSRIHYFNIVFVDYDDQGGAMGRAVRDAYSSLQADSFPSLIEKTPLEFEETFSLVESVCRTDYWAALYIKPGASDRIRNALTNASSYNPSDIIGYIWNEARYPTVIDGALQSNIQLLSSTARTSYIENLNLTPSSESLPILASPWTLQSTNLQPTTQGSRVIYNNIVIILILIQEFFYLGTINGLYAQHKLYARSGPYRIILLRNLNSLAYTFIGSLCVTASIFAFRAGWDFTSAQFILTWLTFWLFAHVNFLTLDVFTIWVPHGYVPLALITWIIMNVTSVLLPFELSPGFYKLGYVLPAHEVYQTLTDIWSMGCNNQLRYSLPVLFVWEVVSLVLSSLGVFRRCHFAVLAEERVAEEFKEKVDAAVGEMIGRKKNSEEKSPETVEAERSGTRSDRASSIGNEETGELRDELAGIMERANTRQRRERDRGEAECDFGPSFPLPFSHDSDSEETV